MLDHYKSWGALKKWLEDTLCEKLKGRVTYFLTCYSDVHNSYGRAAVRVDGEERVIFSWAESLRQEREISELWSIEGRPRPDPDRYEQMLKPQWDEHCTYSDYDFLSAVLSFRNMPVQDALHSDDFIIMLLAVMDKRVGKRSLLKIGQSEEYLMYPDWVKQFYLLRLSA